MISVLIHTDEPILASGAVQVLSEAGIFDVTGVSSTKTDLVERMTSNVPDILLVDLEAEIAFATLNSLHREAPGCKIVLWVRAASVEFTYQALELGVHGILAKTLPPERLIECLRNIAEGAVRFDLSLNSGLTKLRRIHLSNRERQLVNLLCQGFKNKEIAVALSISEGTVKVYLSRLFQKTGVKDRFELALYGLKNANNMGAFSVDTHENDRRKDPARWPGSMPASNRTNALFDMTSSLWRS